MSASRMPTLAPSWASARPRLTATVDFPTPPLPDATAIRLLIPSNGLRPCWTECDKIVEVNENTGADGKSRSLQYACSAAISSAPLRAAGNPRSMLIWGIPALDSISNVLPASLSGKPVNGTMNSPRCSRNTAKASWLIPGSLPWGPGLYLIDQHFQAFPTFLTDT